MKDSSGDLRNDSSAEPVDHAGGMADPGPGTEFDGYRLERPIGAGGMGRVYLAHDTVLDRPVAIKFLSALHPDEASRSRFLQEARTIARLQHPCIVAVFRAGEVAGRPYIVSEYVEGESLDRCPLPLPWREVVPIAQDVARGLAAAHHLGIVHRDIKPGNVMRTPQGAKLLDFGIARLVGGSPRPDLVPPSRDSHSGRGAPEIPLEEGPTRPVTVSMGPGDSGMPALGLEVPREVFLTQPGRVMGTPAYMAPEVLRGEEATFASDVFSFGALLYTLLVGEPPPRDQPDASSLLDGIRKAAPDLPAPLASLIGRCLAPDPRDRPPSANEVRAALHEMERGRGEVSVRDPYRGLRPFGMEHEGIFFGRDAEIAAILGRLSSDRLVVVTGDSGVGKSSLCRAGVLPRVASLDRSLSWTAVVVTPGPRPLRSLAAAVADALQGSEERILEAIEEGPETAGRLLCQALGASRGLLLFLDQLEEVVTIAESREAASVLAFLHWFTRAPPGLRLLATVRVDFLGRIASRLSESEILVRHLYFLRPLSKERLREVIVRPAERLGVTFESEALVTTLVEAAAQTDGGLPLLEFTLDRLWEMRDRERGCITEDSLRALGGVEGALGRHGDEVVARLDPETREAARRVLLRLVAPTGTRAEASLEDLCGGDPRREKALEVLVQARLVVARENPPEGTNYRIAHEALLNHWATLRRWITARGEARPIHHRLSQAARDWQRLGRPSDLLWGRDLFLAAGDLDPMDLSPVEREFLSASRNRWKRTRIARLVFAMAVPLAIAGTYLLVRVQARLQLEAQVEAHLTEGRARMEFHEVLRDRLSAREAEAFEAFDQGNLGAGEEVWSDVLRLRQEARETLVQASREFETAVLIRPRDREAMAWTARSLHEMALLAERSQDLRTVLEVLGRLALFDEEGHWRRQLERPGRIRLPCAQVERMTVERESRSEATGGLTRAVVFEGPCLEESSWPPGSYRIVLRASGREPSLLPVLVRRGEEVRLVPPVVPEGSIPRGFTLVAGGLTLVGSPDEDGVRRGFFHAPPMHEVLVDSFLISVHETTFGEYLAWLETLPERDRQERLPRVETGGFQGSLRVDRTPDGSWEIEIRPAGKVYRARSGEPIRYEGRVLRRESDWLRWPVVGVTADQAREHAEWLRSTGRVPGARLCREFEWERAARGADGRPYPHGWSLDPSDANHDETYGKRPEAMGPDEVGSYPQSASPFGVQDMAGNVWEWTVSAFQGVPHAARGGSFYFDVNSARTYNRETPEPSFRDVSVGYRLCADLPTP